MAYEHNDIVTVDRMNEAIAEGGGGGGSADIFLNLEPVSGTFDFSESSWIAGDNDRYISSTLSIEDYVLPKYVQDAGDMAVSGGTITINGATYSIPDVIDNGNGGIYVTEGLPSDIEYFSLSFQPTGEDGISAQFDVGTTNAEGSEPELSVSMANIGIYVLSAKMAALV